VEEFRQVCDCRKPHPGMLLSARDYFDIDMAASYMVGDKLEDMQAAAAANVGTKVLVRTGKPITPEAENAADWVLKSSCDAAFSSLSRGGVYYAFLFQSQP
ncbi:HAD hydrolase-like protein, partial [Escherichia coli]|uniref:HAD hydrolase-like protein n=1 Tax=Escherichia coli TaxID=562 RepID=UPI0034592B02